MDGESKAWRVMFVCKANSTRSQMAEGWARLLSKGKNITVASSGLKKTGVNPLAVQSMKEAGVDISDQTSKALAEFSPDDFDVVVSLCGCGVHLPSEWAFKGKEGKVFEDWNLTDPAGQPYEVYAPVRDRIHGRVERLFAMLQGEVKPSEAASKFLEEDLEDNKGHVVMISRTYCPWCKKAKALLKSIEGLDTLSKVHTIEVDLRTDELDLMDVVKGKVGQKSTPQVWVCGVHVGGYTDLAAMHEAGNLVKMLKENSLLN